MTFVQTQLESARIRLLTLRHTHVEWLANYLEWDALQRRGEPLEKEKQYAFAQLRLLRFDIALVELQIKILRKLS